MFQATPQSGPGRAKLSADEAAYLRANGITPPESIDVPHLLPENLRPYRAFKLLKYLHAEDLSLLEVIAACNLYGVDDICLTAEMIADVCIEMRQSIKDKKEWVQ